METSKAPVILNTKEQENEDAICLPICTPNQELGSSVDLTLVKSAEMPMKKERGEGIIDMAAVDEVWSEDTEGMYPTGMNMALTTLALLLVALLAGLVSLLLARTKTPQIS
jgi:hypothetical protein